MQILLFLLGRNGAVKNAVGIAGDGGHGRFQLMGNIGNKLAALPLGLLQGVSHVVERLGQLRDLGDILVIVHAHIEITVGKAARRLGHLADRARLAHADPCAHDEREQQYGHGGHKEHADEGAPHRRQRPHAGYSQHKADGRPTALDRDADDKVRFFVNAVERCAQRVSIAAHRAVCDLLRNGQHQPLKRGIGRQQDAAVGAADKELCVRDGGGKVRQLAQA